MDGCHPNWRGDHGKNWFKQTLEIEGNKNNDLSSQLYHFILDNKAGETPTFHANFMGNSLSYVWDRMKNEFFITGKNQNFQITGSIISPTIIDGKGIKYSFNAKEESSPEGYLVDPEMVYQDYTLFLTKIESPTGHTIQLRYVDNGTITSVYKITENLYSHEYPVNAIGSSYREVKPEGSNLLDRSLSQLYRTKALRLSEIESDEALVKFIPSSDFRKDLDGNSRKLSKIEIYQKNGSQKKLLKSFSFSSSYFSKVTTGGNTVKDLFDNLGNSSIYNGWFASDDFMYYRLRLDSYSEEDSNGKQVAKYSFGYNNGLPCKASAAIDYWGYYNGEENFNGRYHTLLPKHWDELTSDVEDGFPKTVYFTGADRRFNENCASAGMLSFITYPTGGTTSITYEGHRFSNYKYFDAAKTTSGKSFKDVDIYATNQSYGKVSGASLNESTFNISEEGIYKMTLSYMISNLAEQPSWRYILSNPLQLYHYSTIYDRNGPHEVVSACDVLSAVPSDTVGTRNITKSRTLTLFPGKYKLMIAGGASLNIGVCPQQYYQIKGNIKLEKSTYTSIGAGVRVKSISENDGNGNFTTTNYRYTYPDLTSSGRLSVPAIYARRKILVYQNEMYQDAGSNQIKPATAKEIRYAEVSGNNAVPDVPVVGYERVTVKQESNGTTNGKEVFTYRNRPWGINMLTYCRQVPDPRNGMLLSDSVFDSKGKLIKTTDNSYKWRCVDSRLLSAVIENIYSGPNEVTGGNALASENAYADALGGGCMQIYLYPSVQFALASSNSSQKEYHGDNCVTIKTSTQYGQTNTLDSISVQSQSETGTTVTTETFYPQNALSQANMKTLADKHITEIPIECLTSISNEDGTYVIGSQRYLYDNNGNIITEYSLDTERSITRSSFSLLKDNYAFSSFKANAVFSYNSSGKPRVVKENNCDVVTYIWGYYSNYPIAVIRGADYPVVRDLLGGDSAVKALETAPSPTISARELHSKLSKLAGCCVSTYSFNPQIGMVEMISPNGESTTYTYDAFSRLAAIKDHNGIVSSSFKYNYKQ
ncbi:hypothetical protein ACTQ53_14950 [Prevotella sp. Sow4_E9_plate]|uniref:hypothetical protein n=1 Tax=Prevotella sp. Sow4_E9_plate TaxID=3438802 RepID=UPI003F9D62C3